MCKPNLLIGDLIFEASNNFKYLGVNIENKNNLYQEVNEEIMSRNRRYNYNIVKFLKSKLLS